MKTKNKLAKERAARKAQAAVNLKHWEELAEERKKEAAKAAAAPVPVVG